MYKLYYSDTEGQRLRASLHEGDKIGFRPLIELAESESGKYEDATICLIGFASGTKVALWSNRFGGIRWSEQGEERWP